MHDSRWSAVAVIAVLAVALCSCDAETDIIEPPVVENAPLAVVGFSEDFTPVDAETGETSDARCYVANAGDAVLEIAVAGIVGTNATDFALTDGAFPASLEPGAKLEFSVRFAPSENADSAKRAELRFTTNEPGGVATLRLSGSATAIPRQEIAIVSEGGSAPLSTLDFGETYDGEVTPTRWFEVLNTGTIDATVSSVGPPADSPFEVDAISGAIPPGGRLRFGLRFRGDLVHSPGASVAMLVVSSAHRSREIDLAATPRIDEAWALAMLMGPKSDSASIAGALTRYRARSDAEGKFAVAILGSHLFAHGTESATEALAIEAWNAAKAAPPVTLALVYRGVAAAFVASKKGSSGGSFIDDFESALAAVPTADAHWFARYWRGVTYLRTAKGIKDNFFANLIYGSRADAWIVAGKADLDAVKAAWQTASLAAGTYSPDSWDRAAKPVPEEIRQDMLSTPYWTW